MNNIMQKFNNYDKEQLKSIIKIYVNNPLLDLINCVHLYESGFKDDEKMVKYDKTDNKVIYIYIDYDDLYKYYHFSKEKFIKEDIKLNFNEIKYKFYNETKICVEINKEIDFLKKDSFIKDNVLYISNILSEDEQCLYIINEYIDIICSEYNSIGVQQLSKLMIMYYYRGKEIDVPQILANSFELNRLYVFSLAFGVFYKTITIFDRRFLKLNHLIKIDITEDITKLNILKEIYGMDTISQVKKDILNDNLQDYPYYYM